jgi:hypothetical protein
MLASRSPTRQASFSNIPLGKDALLIYAGSLLLTVIAWAVLTCLPSVLNANKYVSYLFGTLANWEKRNIHKFSTRCYKDVTEINERRSEVEDFQNNNSALLQRIAIHSPSKVYAKLSET